MGSSKPLSAKQAAARLSVALKDLPRRGPWTRQQVRELRAERPEWLTLARREYARRKDEEAARQRQALDARKADFSCFCCKAKFAFTINSGGLCEACNEGDCPGCGEDDEDWLYG
ncbi:MULTISPECIES: hypothetical protein [Kribbella]|uniref:Uncharacterized protein n=2 Tax=Kribbella TaxID=182639 RepID=A0A4R0I505_9ACTN|nr:MULTISPECIES: hypothetical protein [Kribbella]TCC15319.1 hypothetical protein E0H50_42220 [Kribbella sindirgiensis]TCC37751.1 hypothetical protein E0H92_14780 [Kribbella speibonae]